MKAEVRRQKAEVRRQKAEGRRAFTLVELLVVVAIIGLLVGILVPVVQKAFLQAEEAKTKSRIMAIHDACIQYQNDTGYYPGQQYIAHVGQYDLPNLVWTGSQYLAKCLCPNLTEVQDPLKPPPPVYLASSREEVTTIKTDTGVPLPDSISDRASEPLAILYYPARLGVTFWLQAGESSPDQPYDRADNLQYMPGHINDADNNWTKWRTFMTDARPDARPVPPGAVTGRPLNLGRFVLVAAGQDREYQSTDDIVFPPK